MYDKEYILGIDTSAYKTSIAIVNRDGDIILDLRRSLHVKQGAHGLRQSHALFQHVVQLPEMLKIALADDMRQKIAAVCVSSTPRNVIDSYMPVFLVGEGHGTALASALSVPFYKFSHQEGHIEAIRHYSHLGDETNFLAYHLSGGTCELLSVSKKGIKIIGGSKDISFGQVLDRIGTSIGLDFPSGEAMDKLALKAKKNKKKSDGCIYAIEPEDKPFRLRKIAIKGLSFNLSGLETQTTRHLIEFKGQEEILVEQVFDRIAECLQEVTQRAVDKTKINKVLFAGGVSSSIYIRRELKKHFENRDVIIKFGKKGLSQDNAIGIALLGGKTLWQ